MDEVMNFEMLMLTWIECCLLFTPFYLRLINCKTFLACQLTTCRE